MGTLKIGSAKNMVGVTIEPSTVLFNGDNVKYIKSGLTEIWGYIKALVPTMTSNTTPYGKVSGSSVHTDTSQYDYFKAFDGDDSTSWISTGNKVTNQWLEYEFVNPVSVKSVYLKPSYRNAEVRAKNVKIQAYNGIEWIDVSEVYTFENVEGVSAYIDVTNDIISTRFRVFCIDSYASTYIGFITLQFYGSQLVGLVPTLKSDDGNVLGSGYYKDYALYKAFNGTNTNYQDSWNTSGDGTNVAYIGYNFGVKKKVSKIYIQNRNDTSVRPIKSFMLQGSDDLETWHNIEEFNVTSSEANAEQYFTVTNTKSYKAFRILVTQVYDTAYVGLGRLQFYS